MYSDFFTLEQTISQSVSISWSQVETECGVLAADATVRDLERINQRARSIEADHAQGTGSNSLIVYT